MTSRRRKTTTTLALATTAVATYGLLKLRSRRLITARQAPTPPRTLETRVSDDLDRWRALFPFQPRAHTRAIWAISRQQWNLPAHRAALSTFAAVRAAHAFFREQDSAPAQLWLTRHHDLRRTASGADALARASAELRCWSTLQALTSGAPDEVARAALMTFFILDGWEIAEEDAAAQHATRIINAVRSAEPAPRGRGH